MTVGDLISALQHFDRDVDVMVMDSVGPQDASSPSLYTIVQEDEDDCADCDGRVGEVVVI